MDASLETLVIEGYVFACSLSIPSPGPARKVTDQELIALAVAQVVTGLVSDRQFLGTIGRLLPGFFPDLPEQSQYDRRLRRLTPWITTVQLAVAELIADGHVRLVDGTVLGCADYAGCASKSTQAGPSVPPVSSISCGSMRSRHTPGADGRPIRSRPSHGGHWPAQDDDHARHSEGTRGRPSPLCQAR
jgi:hypothetical protein